MFTTNQQIHIVTYCIHLHIHHTSRTPYLFQFLRLRRLCGDDSDFSEKSEAMCQFFDKRGYPVSVVQAGHHRAQQIDRQSALQTAEKEALTTFYLLLHFTLTTTQFYLSFLKTLNYSKTIQNSTIFSQPPLISFKRDKNLGNCLVRSSFQTNNQSGTFKCARSKCKTCSFIHNVEKKSGPKRSIIAYSRVFTKSSFYNNHSASFYYRFYSLVMSCLLLQSKMP